MKVEVRLSRRDFVRFSLFDAFSLKKGWLRPAVFAVILGAAAGVCFALGDRRGPCCWERCCWWWPWASPRPGF